MCRAEQGVRSAQESAESNVKGTNEEVFGRSQEQPAGKDQAWFHQHRQSMLLSAAIAFMLAAFKQIEWLAFTCACANANAWLIVCMQHILHMRLPQLQHVSSTALSTSAWLNPSSPR